MTASPSAPRSTRLPRRMVAAVTVATTLLAPVFLNLVGNSAFADTVTNNVTVGGNDTTTVGSTTSVSYSLNARNDPGEPGEARSAMPPRRARWSSRSPSRSRTARPGR